MIRTSAEVAGRGQSAGRRSFDAGGREGKRAVMPPLQVVDPASPDKRSNHFSLECCNGWERYGEIAPTRHVALEQCCDPYFESWRERQSCYSHSCWQKKQAGRLIKASLLFCEMKWVRAAWQKLSISLLCIVCAKTDRYTQWSIQAIESAANQPYGWLA